MDRIAILNEILTQNPNDTFARYGLAMEYSKPGDRIEPLQNSASCWQRIRITRRDTSWPRKH